MNYTIDSLIERHNDGERLKYLFFWGHQPSRDGRPGPFCFSQWAEYEFAVEGVLYKTAEHWMMAQKARLFGDEDILQKILQSDSPGGAKDLGRRVKGFDQQTWKERRYGIVKQGNIHKFNAHEDIREYLLNTRERILVEASPLDRIWGIGLAKEAPSIENPENWKGLNLLGFALMEVRDELSGT